MGFFKSKRKHYSSNSSTSEEPPPVPTGSPSLSKDEIIATREPADLKSFFSSDFSDDSAAQTTTLAAPDSNSTSEELCKPIPPPRPERVPANASNSHNSASRGSNSNAAGPFRKRPIKFPPPPDKFSWQTDKKLNKAFPNRPKSTSFIPKAPPAPPPPAIKTPAPTISAPRIIDAIMKSSSSDPTFCFSSDDPAPSSTSNRSIKSSSTISIPEVIQKKSSFFRALWKSRSSASSTDRIARDVLSEESLPRPPSMLLRPVHSLGFSVLEYDMPPPPPE